VAAGGQRRLGAAARRTLMIKHADTI
jgi:hypothetical protein